MYQNRPWAMWPASFANPYSNTYLAHLHFLKVLWSSHGPKNKALAPLPVTCPPCLLSCFLPPPSTCQSHAVLTPMMLVLPCMGALPLLSHSASTQADPTNPFTQTQFRLRMPPPPPPDWQGGRPTNLNCDLLPITSSKAVRGRSHHPHSVNHTDQEGLELHKYLIKAHYSESWQVIYMSIQTYKDIVT